MNLLDNKTKLVAIGVSIVLATGVAGAMNSQESIHVIEPEVVSQEVRSEPVQDTVEAPADQAIINEVTVEEGEQKPKEVVISPVQPDPAPKVVQRTDESEPVINNYKVVSTELSSIQNAYYPNKTNYTCVHIMEDGARLWTTATLNTKENYMCQFQPGSVMSPAQYISFRQD